MTQRSSHIDDFGIVHGYFDPLGMQSSGLRAGVVGGAVFWNLVIVYPP